MKHPILKEISSGLILTYNKKDPLPETVQRRISFCSLRWTPDFFKRILGIGNQLLTSMIFRLVGDDIYIYIHIGWLNTVVLVIGGGSKQCCTFFFHRFLGSKYFQVDS